MSAAEISDFNLFIYVKRSIRTRSTETAMLNTLSSSQKLTFSILLQYIVCSINHKKIITVISDKCKPIMPSTENRHQFSKRDASVILYATPLGVKHFLV